jgi:ATP-dependent helicase HrpA
VELELQKDLAWLQKDLRALARLEPLHKGFMSPEELQQGAYENLRACLLPQTRFPRLVQSCFEAAVEQGRERLPGLAMQLADRLETILKMRLEILSRHTPPAATTPPGRGKSVLSHLAQLEVGRPKPRATPAFIAAELQGLLPNNFLQQVPFAQLGHFQRYLKALQIRAERALLNPVKDQERARQLAPYLEVLRGLKPAASSSPEKARLAGELRWMIEEFKVSVFAQELGTAMPVSPKRLDQLLERIRATP